MRLRYLIPPLLLVVIAAGVVTVHAAGDRDTSFSSGAAQLRDQWARDEAEGVPASSIAPLRQQLASLQPSADWWSPGWLGNDGQALLARLRSETEAAYGAAVDAQRTQAEAVLTRWNGFAQQQGPWLASQAVADATRWPDQLAAARTPLAISALAASWSAFLTQQQEAVTAAQQARLASATKSNGAPEAALAGARRLLSVASSANLDPGGVATLTDTLAGQLAAGDTAGAAATTPRLVAAMATLQSLINLNNHVGGLLQPLLWSVDQAVAEGTPNAAALAGRRSGIGAQFVAARTTAQLSAVAATVTALQGQVAAELAANQCAHSVGAGKVITISLSLQEMVFYQDGCAVKATPVTTGRPQLRTPTGRFSIFYKKTPFTFISPWPPSSPYYYYPSPVSWVMEFAGGGYFIHDAPWESSAAYGPGGENNLAAASHGCVHTPGPVMQWAFSWTPLGTPVVISA